MKITFKITDIPRWIADQLVRHTVGVHSYMATSRPDRGGKLRKDQSMEDLTDLLQSYNAESFINMCNQRLCVGCVSKQTRETVQLIVEKLNDKEPEIAFFCVPNCIVYGACKENAFTKCQHFESYLEFVNREGNNANALSILADIDSRYKMYHKFNATKS